MSIGETSSQSYYPHQNQQDVKIEPGEKEDSRKYGEKNPNLSQYPQILFNSQVHLNNNSYSKKKVKYQKDFGRKHGNYTKKDRSDPRLEPLKVAARNKNENECLYILQDIFKKGLVPDTYLCNLILNLFVEKDQPGNAIQLFEEMKEKGIPLDKYTYNTFIKLFDINGIRRLMNEMKTNNIRPKKVTYTTLLGRYKEYVNNDKEYVNNEDVRRTVEKEVMDLMEEMKKECIKKDKIIFDIVLSLLIKLGNPGEAESLYKKHFLSHNYTNNQKLDVNGKSIYELYEMKYSLKEEIRKKFICKSCKVENEKRLKISNALTLEMTNVNGDGPTKSTKSTNVREQNSSKNIPQTLKFVTENTENKKAEPNVIGNDLTEPTNVEKKNSSDNIPQTLKSVTENEEAEPNIIGDDLTKSTHVKKQNSSDNIPQTPKFETENEEAETNVIGDDLTASTKSTNVKEQNSLDNIPQTPKSYVTENEKAETTEEEDDNFNFSCKCTVL